MEFPSTGKGSDAMHTSRVKVLRGPITFGGWKGQRSLDGDSITVDGTEAGRRLVISFRRGEASILQLEQRVVGVPPQQRQAPLAPVIRRPPVSRPYEVGNETNGLVTERLGHHHVRVFGV